MALGAALGSALGAVLLWPAHAHAQVERFALVIGNNLGSLDDVALRYAEDDAIHRTSGLTRFLVITMAACGAAACGTVVDHEQAPGRGLLDEGRVDVRLDGTSDCNTTAGHRLDRFVAEPREGSELHVVGIYDALRAPGGGVGRFEIEVHRKTPMVLVLSAHEATEWIVRADADTQIEAVIVTGYHAQSAQVPAGVPVTNRSYALDGSFFGNAYMWPHAGEACADFFPAATCDTLGDAWQVELGFHIDNISKLVDGVELWSGLELTSFHGCREMSQLTLEDDQPLAAGAAVAPCAGAGKSK